MNCAVQAGFSEAVIAELKEGDRKDIVIIKKMSLYETIHIQLEDTFGFTLNSTESMKHEIFDIWNICHRMKKSNLFVLMFFNLLFLKNHTKIIFCMLLK